MVKLNVSILWEFSAYMSCEYGEDAIQFFDLFMYY